MPEKNKDFPIFLFFSFFLKVVSATLQASEHAKYAAVGKCKWQD